MSKTKYDIEVEIGSAVCSFSLKSSKSQEDEDSIDKDIQDCRSKIEQNKTTNKLPSHTEEPFVPTVDDILANLDNKDTSEEEGELGHYEIADEREPYEVKYLDQEAPVYYQTLESHRYETVKTFCDQELKQDVIDLFRKMAIKRIVKGVSFYEENIVNCDFHDDNGFVTFNASIKLNSHICHFKVEVNEKKQISIANAKQILEDSCRTYLTTEHFVQLGGYLNNFVF